MFVAVFRILAVALICSACVGCYRTPVTASPAVAPATSPDTLRYGLLIGTVVDSATTLPLVGAMVTVMVHGTDPAKGHVAGTVTDTTGRFAFRVAYGRYDLHFVRIGFTKTEQTGVRVASGKPDAIVVRLPPAPALPNIKYNYGTESKPPSPQR
jgi:hypothetical protein